MKRGQHPCSQAIPENRRGTRTHKRYMRFCCPEDGSMTVALASPRQWAKAGRAYSAGKTDVPGRIVNALLQHLYADVMRDAEERAYGNWR